MPNSEKMSALVELAGAVAHELNNIFTAVAGNLSLLDEDDSDRHARIGDVIRTAQRGIVLSSKLQAFAGRQPLRRQRLDVSRLAGLVVRDLPVARLNKVHLHISLAREDCICFVDEEKLRASLEEILRNALAAMPPAGGRIVVETSLHTATAQNAPAMRPGRYARIAIADTGRGMAPDIAARAVDPLFTTKAPGINAGWGLSNCAGFVRQSGGSMTLSSAPGRGTRIEIYLPLQQG